jgi:hypothetical protein
MENIAVWKGDSKLVDQIGQFATIPFSFIKTAKEKKLDFHACWLFVILRYYTNGKTGNAFPSYTTIHNLTGMTRKKISDSLKKLEENGWLEKKKRFGSSTIYTLIIPKPLEFEDNDFVEEGEEPF